MANGMQQGSSVLDLAGHVDLRRTGPYCLVMNSHAFSKVQVAVPESVAARNAREPQQKNG
jgi:hypothetical protein